MKKILAIGLLLLATACTSGTNVGQQPRVSNQSLNSGNGSTVTVQTGDTVYSIARRTNVKMSSIISLNHLQTPYVLQPGQLIHLPESDNNDTSLTSATQPYDRGVGMDTPTSLAPLPVENGNVVDNSVGGAVQAENLDGTNPGDRHDMVLTPLGPSTTPAAGESVISSIPADVTPDASGGSNIADAAQEATAPATNPAPAAQPGVFDWPVEGHVTNSSASGMDIAAPRGTPVQAASGGTVIKASAGGADGSTVVVQHPNGYTTTYSHMERMMVDKDTVVGKGDVIGTVGQGVTKSPLLHFSLAQGGKPLNASAWLPAK